MNFQITCWIDLWQSCSIYPWGNHWWNLSSSSKSMRRNLTNLLKSRLGISAVSRIIAKQSLSTGKWYTRTLFWSSCIIRKSLYIWCYQFAQLLEVNHFEETNQPPTTYHFWTKLKISWFLIFIFEQPYECFLKMTAM